jgi:hypothetical protein
MSYANGVAEMNIRNIELADAALYTCRAQNTHGSTSTTAELRVSAAGSGDDWSTRKLEIDIGHRPQSLERSSLSPSKVS